MKNPVPSHRRQFGSKQNRIMPARLVRMVPTSVWADFAKSYELSPREVQVAKAICADSKRSALARQLGCKTGTAQVYVERLYKKTNVHDRVQLIVLVAGLAIIHFKQKTSKSSEKTPKHPKCCVVG